MKMITIIDSMCSYVYNWSLCRWSRVTGAEINQPVPFNFNFRAWYILWSPVSGGACALQQEAEWLLITLYLVPRALHPSSIRQTRTADSRGGLPGRTGSRYCWTWRYTLRGCFRNRCAPAFDIVTVEGEGCSAAGWEEMSEGDSGRKTDGISADEGSVRVSSLIRVLN